MNILKPLAAIALAGALALGGAAAANAATPTAAATSTTATAVKAAKTATPLTLVKASATQKANGSYTVTLKVKGTVGSAVEVYAGGSGIGLYATGVIDSTKALTLKFNVSASVYNSGAMAIYSYANPTATGGSTGEIVLTKSTAYGPAWAAPAAYVAASPK